MKSILVIAATLISVGSYASDATYFSIYVGSPLGPQCSYGVTANTSVEDLKVVVQEKFGIDPSAILIYKGMQLRPADTLGSYEIGAGAVLHCVPAMAAGMVGPLAGSPLQRAIADMDRCQESPTIHLDEHDPEASHALLTAIASAGYSIDVEVVAGDRGTVSLEQLSAAELLAVLHEVESSADPRNSALLRERIARLIAQRTNPSS